VFFVDDHFEGREEWVPPPRLKVPWDQAEHWQAREDKFAAVEAASSQSYDTPEYWAASRVLAQLPEELIEMNYGRGGYVVVPDPDRLVRFIDAEASLLADPVGFVDDDGSYTAPWAVTERLAQHVAPRFAPGVLAHVAREQDRHRHRAIYGEQQTSGRRSGYCSPEVCADVDRKWQPTHDLLRQWCGQDVVEQYEEVKALQEEISKLVTLSEHAIEKLGSLARPISSPRNSLLSPNEFPNRQLSRVSPMTSNLAVDLSQPSLRAMRKTRFPPASGVLLPRFFSGSLLAVVVPERFPVVPGICRFDSFLVPTPLGGRLSPQLLK
jgi:hypothetical protein